MTRNKVFGVVIALTVFIAGLIAGWLGSGEREAVPAFNPDNLIRLHVVANSDTLPDQALKYRVRDAVIGAMSSRFEDAQDIDLARELVRNNLEYIASVAEKEILACGYDYPVQVTAGQYQFPSKTYYPTQPGADGPLTLPQGEYEALRIVIGAGQGANWWCVLFPPLCFTSIEQEAEPALAGAGPVKVELRLKVVDVWREKIMQLTRYQDRRVIIEPPDVPKA